MVERNVQRRFTAEEEYKLGNYVYVLKDPRDQKIFYVGKGTQSRLFDHFVEASSCRSRTDNVSSKTRRILEIWEAGFDVDWLIVRRSIQSLADKSDPNEFSEDIEAAIIDVLSQSQSGPPLNLVSGKRNGVRGMLNSDEVRALGALPVNPINAYKVVFAFPIQRALSQNRTPYDATHKAWLPSSFMNPGVIAVGLAYGRSHGVFDVHRWEPTPDGNKVIFHGEEHSDHELLNKNWTAITSAAGGFWQRGNYIVVEFDGGGHFRFLRGSKDKESWIDLV